MEKSFSMKENGTCDKVLYQYKIKVGPVPELARWIHAQVSGNLTVLIAVGLNQQAIVLFSSPSFPWKSLYAKQHSWNSLFPKTVVTFQILSKFWETVEEKKRQPLKLSSNCLPPLE